jgi:hypothetical protein
VKSGSRRWKSTSFLVLAFWTYTVAGCYAYIPLPEDPPSVRRSKDAKRIAVSVATLGLAQIGFGKRRRTLAAERRAFEEGVKFTHSLAEAGTLRELILMMGSNPQCIPAGEEISCQWDIDTRSYEVRSGTGGAVFYGLFSSYTRAQIVQTGGAFFRLICILPDDGSARTPGSCSHTTQNGFQKEGFWLTCRKHPVFCGPQYGPGEDW